MNRRSASDSTKAWTLYGHNALIDLLVLARADRDVAHLIDLETLFASSIASPDDHWVEAPAFPGRATAASLLVRNQQPFDRVAANHHVP